MTENKKVFGKCRRKKREIYLQFIEGTFPQLLTAFTAAVVDGMWIRQIYLDMQ